MAQTNRPPSGHDLLVTFEGPQAARDAMLSLERHGFDADEYELMVDTGAPATGRRAQAEDMRIAGDAVKHFSGAGIIGAVIGAAILVGVMHLIGFGSLQWEADIGAAIGGAVVGFFLAGLWNVFSSTAANNAVWDTYLPDVHGSPTLVVHVTDDDREDRARQIIEELHPVKVERAA